MRAIRYRSSAAGLMLLALIGAPRDAASQNGAQLPPWPATRDSTRCTDATGNVREWLDRASSAMGLDRIRDRVVHYTATDIVQENYQSDRAYPPFFSVPTSRDTWYDPATGMERGTQTAGGVFGGGRGSAIASDARASFVVTDTALVPSAGGRWSAVQDRPLNVWAEIADFRADTDVRVVARCTYRDYPREVIARPGVWGEERLFLDANTALPVAMMRDEPHYLWGQQHVTYVYSVWDRVAENGGLRPRSVARLTDGAVEIERVDGPWRLLSRDSAPPMPAAPNVDSMPPAIDPFLRPLPVDTARLGADTWTLRNVGYQETVTMVRDTVYLFDATQGDGRARLDSTWIAHLYPTHRAVVVVVTDLAWPHVAGVRFWVARGATIVSHRASREFLQRVVARRWMHASDALELARVAGRKPALRLVELSDSLTLAGGAVRLFAIDGIASEGALMAYLPRDSVLWAGDYVQTLSAPTEYAREVWEAARRHALQPKTVAAEHLRPTPWARLVQVVSP